MTLNSHQIYFFLSIKTLLFFTTSIYILYLPLAYFSGVRDGLNIFGYTSPEIILKIESMLCIALSLISFSQCYINLKKLLGEMRKNEE